MGKKLYVGNLGYELTDSDLTKMFEPHGTVESAQVIMDRDAGRSKGFGFVEMRTDEQAKAAIGALNGQDSGGRVLTVDEAKPLTQEGRHAAGESDGHAGGCSVGDYGNRF
jgi:cold-inducible RNA-binding protein